MHFFAAVAVSLLMPLAAQPDAADHPNPPPASLALELNRGICIDRQFRTVPPESLMRITREDIRLIKSMGFEFVKFIINPEPLMADGHLDHAKTEYLQYLVSLAAAEQLPAVMCIHPEWEFKKRLLSNPEEFEKLLVFLEDIARFLAERSTPKQLALQLMTEPIAEGANWNELQPRMWQAVRRAMPDHTLILAGDQVGKIEGLVTTRPVNDANVIYSFTSYDPFVFTLQGGEWLTPLLWSHLGAVPYPSSPEIVAERKQAILEMIPADPPDWRPAAEGMLNEYGDARWNKDKMAAYIGKLAEWNKSHGGGLKIWCAEFGCYQRTVKPDDRYRFIRDLRETFEANNIGWAYWSYNENFTVMTPGSPPFGPAETATPDEKMLEALLGNNPRCKSADTLTRKLP